MLRFFYYTFYKAYALNAVRYFFGQINWLFLCDYFKLLNLALPMFKSRSRFAFTLTALKLLKALFVLVKLIQRVCFLRFEIVCFSDSLGKILGIYVKLNAR